MSVVLQLLGVEHGKGRNLDRKAKRVPKRRSATPSAAARTLMTKAIKANLKRKRTGHPGEVDRVNKTIEVSGNKGARATALAGRSPRLQGITLEVDPRTGSRRKAASASAVFVRDKDVRQGRLRGRRGAEEDRQVVSSCGRQARALFTQRHEGQERKGQQHRRGRRCGTPISLQGGHKRGKGTKSAAKAYSFMPEAEPGFKTRGCKVRRESA
jgi:hypothetical protein